MRPTENDLIRLYKNAISELLLRVASSNLVGIERQNGISS